MNRRIAFLIVFIICICDFSQATTYKVTDLGTLGGSWSVASSINESGQIAGTSSLKDSDNSHAFLYSGGTMTDLGTFGGRSSCAFGINNHGQVVGEAAIVKQDEYGQSVYHAFLYDGSTKHDLGTLGGTQPEFPPESNANDINDSGQVTGWSDSSDGYAYAFLYNGSSMHSLDTHGAYGSNGVGINNSGQVVGKVFTTELDEYGNPVSHAFLYSGSMRDLGTLGGTDSWAHGINDSGKVVGEAQIAGNAAWHAFLYNGSTMIDLGTIGGNYSEAQGINAKGQIVGVSKTADNTAYHAFLYDGSAMTDLNTLINPSSGWTLNYAYDINDAGQIVGKGYNGSQYHAFLLTPNSAEFNWLNPNGSWGSASNWNPASVPSIGGKAIFANSSAAITLDGNRIVSDLQFNGGICTISPGSAPSRLVMQSPGNWATTIEVLAGSHTIDAPLEMNSDLTITIAEGAALTVDQIRDLDGSKNLIVDGDLTASSISVGTLTLRSGATPTRAPSNGFLPAPEPTSLTLLGISMVGLLAYAWRRRKGEATPRRSATERIQSL
jgi:probable HAF family extracellular repeat protein